MITRRNRYLSFTINTEQTKVLLLFEKLYFIYIDYLKTNTYTRKRHKGVSFEIQIKQDKNYVKLFKNYITDNSVSQIKFYLCFDFPPATYILIFGKLCSLSIDYIDFVVCLIHVKSPKAFREI